MCGWMVQQQQQRAKSVQSLLIRSHRKRSFQIVRNAISTKNYTVLLNSGGSQNFAPFSNRAQYLRICQPTISSKTSQFVSSPTTVSFWLVLFKHFHEPPLHRWIAGLLGCLCIIGSLWSTSRIYSQFTEPIGRSNREYNKSFYPWKPICILKDMIAQPVFFTFYFTNAFLLRGHDFMFRDLTILL